MNTCSETDILVVIPAKNESRYISSCLDAVLCQNYPSFVVVVVDNGSTDNTVQIVKGIFGVNLLVKLGGTISSVRNFGSKFLESKYIAFLDGDSVPPVSWLQTGFELLKDEKVSCVGFPPSPPTTEESWVSKTWYMMSSSVKHKNGCYVSWLSSFNLIVKREDFEKVGGFDESLETCEDFDLGVKLNRHSRILFSDRLSVRHLGVVNSMKDFFLKELWRGKSNLKQLKNSEDGLMGIVGVGAPLFYILSILLLLISSFFAPKSLILFLSVLVGLPLAFVGRRLQSFRQIIYLPKMLLLASIYLFARGLSIIWK